MVVVVLKMIFINRFPIVPLDLSSVSIIQRCLVSVWLQPLWLKRGRGNCTILLSSVNYSLHFHEGEYQDEGRLLSPFSPHYHCSLPACLFPPLLPSFIFLPLLLQKCRHLHLYTLKNASKDWEISLCRKWKVKF